MRISPIQINTYKYKTPNFKNSLPLRPIVIIEEPKPEPKEEKDKK